MVKKSWRIVSICTVVLLTAIGLTVKLSGGEHKPKVIFAVEESESQYWRIVVSGAKKAFRDFGINGQVLAQDSVYPTQEKLLKHALERSPDALIVVPLQLSDIRSVLTEYKQRNIPVLFVDTDADWLDKTAYIGTDNNILGQKAGQLLASMLQPGDKVALFGGNSENADDRIIGAKRTLEAAGLQTAARQFDQVNDLDTVKSVMNSLIHPDMNQTYTDIKGVFATYDNLALSILQVLEEQGIKVPAVGADGIIEMVKVIEEGALTATVAQNPYDMGYQSVEHALKAIKGEMVDKRIDSGVDIITQDNAKEKLEFLTDILDKK